ncbi:MAG: hypothetical protein ACRDPO_19275 [Streptosporangiaceae bacterium]
MLTARQLLEAMLVPSGCDAAYLLATAYGPGRAAFIGEMNATARAWVSARLIFSSFDGMPFPTEHSTYSSPANLIKLGEAAMKYRLFRKIVRQRSYLVHSGPGITTATTGRPPTCCCRATAARWASRPAPPRRRVTACCSRPGAARGA